MPRHEYRGIRVTPAAAEELTRQLLVRPRFRRGTADEYVEKVEARIRKGDLRPHLMLSEYLAARQDVGESLASLCHGLWAIRSFLRARARSAPIDLEAACMAEQIVDGALDVAQIRSLSERSLAAVAEMRRRALEHIAALEDLVAVADVRLFGEGQAA